MSTGEDWKPDGVGISSEVAQIIASAVAPVVHLRLSPPDGKGYPRTACGDGLGQWWTGLVDEVTCTPCRSVEPPEDEGPECDLCGMTSCPDADLPEFSEPRECALKPVYDELRYDRCEYGCGRDITKATVQRAARLLAERAGAGQ